MPGFIQTVAGVPLAGDDYYVQPLRFRVTIKSNDGLETLFTFDSFNTTNELAIQRIDVKRGIGQYSQFELIINDNPKDKLVDRDILDNGNVVIIEAGKTQASYHSICYGICYKFKEKTELSSDITYTMSGLSTAKILDHTLVNFVKIAPPTTLRDGTRAWNLSDSQYFAHNLFRDLFEDRDVIPTPNRIALMNRANFNLEGISDEIQTFIPSDNEPIVVASQVASHLADMAGALWNVDENNTVQFYYPNKDISGFVIKDYLDEGDSGDYTSYRLSDWEITGDIDPTGGFANLLVGVADKLTIVSGEAKALAFMDLYNKDLCQMAYADASAFKDLTLILSKTGAGTDSPDPSITMLGGMIVKDAFPGNPKIGQHYPAAGNENIMATFTIPIKDIHDTPEPTGKIFLNYKRPPSSIVPGQPYWIVLLERGDGSDNTIRWWHNDDFTTLGQWSGVRQVPTGRSEGDPPSNVGWITRNQGPTFTHAYVSSNKILCVASDPASIARWTPNHPVEARVSASWIKYSRTMQEYLSQIIQQTSKKPLTFNTNIVTNPNILFNPGQQVQIVDRALGYTQDKDFIVQLLEDHYWVDATDDQQDAVGNRYCEISVKGFQAPYDYYGKGGG